MNRSQNVSINVNAINDLMINIIDYANDINTILNKISDLVMETQSYYNCSSASVLRNNFQLFSDNHRVLVDNILSYKTDLVNLKNKYSINTDKLTYKINRDIAKTDIPQKYNERR